MLTSATATRQTEARLSLASVRILRLALGTSLALWFSQAIAWQMSWIAPVLASAILAMPMPAVKLKQGLGLVLILAVSLNAGTLLLPTLLNQPAAGMILLALGFFWSFYFTAKGGSAALGTFATVGIALSIAVGSVNLDAVIELISSTSLATAAGVMFVILAHAVLPDALAGDAELTAPPEANAKDGPGLAQARWSAFRSLLIVMPVALFVLFSSGSMAYVPVLLKVASMGQQASNSDTAVAGRSLLLSTLIGGAGAIVGWQVLSIAPTLIVYTLFIAIAGLVMGPRIFAGTTMQKDAATWSYGYLTMLVILAPAVVDGIGGASAGIKFRDRIIMFVLTTLYAVVAVYVVDAFRKEPTRCHPH